MAEGGGDKQLHSSFNHLVLGDAVDIDISDRSEDSCDRHFYSIIGCIEDILLDEQFLKLHDDFMEQNWSHFDDSEENKFVYTDIFAKYHEIIEKYIEEQLVKNVENFNMKELESELQKRRNELEGEIFEILSTFTDFLAFKEKFLDYKAMKEGRVSDLSKEFVVSRYCY